MQWSDLGAQFCLQLAAGTLVALAFVPRAPVGDFFYRLMGTTAALPVLVAGLIPVLADGRDPLAPELLATWLGLLAYPFYAGKTRGRAWGLALAFGLGAALVALGMTLGRILDVDDLPGLLLLTASALATGAVAGSVGLAMVLGHWYLTVPKLKVSYLGRLNRVTIGSMAASLVLVALTCLVFQGELAAASTPLFGPRGLFNIGTRLVVGLVLPLVFAWMTGESVRLGNTRSATGILYASTVLVLIGTALSLNLQDLYGLPL